MAGAPEKLKIGWPLWAQALLIAALVVLGGSRMMMLADTIAVRAGVYGELAWIGGTISVDVEAPDRSVKVWDVSPDGPLAKAGVRTGDFVAFERSHEHLRRQLVGERLDFT